MMIKLLLFIFVAVAQNLEIEDVHTSDESSSEVKTQTGLEAYEESLAEDRNLCADIKVGETRHVQMENPIRSTATVNFPVVENHALNYFVTRTSTGNYKINLPIEFTVGKDYDGGDLQGLNVQDKIQVIDQKYRARVLGCLPALNNLIPTVDGKKIEIAIDSTREAARARGKTWRIAIGKNEGRSHAGEYTSGVGCSTISHELLHLTGLVDQYRENDITGGVLRDSKGKQVLGIGDVTTGKFDCRINAPIKTIMNTDGGFDANGGYTLISSCSCSNPPCSLGPNKLKLFHNTVVSEAPIACPAGYKVIRQDPGQFFTEKDVDSMKFDITKFIPVIAKRDAPPALAPAQIRHILYPGCQAKNRNYYRCESHAYDTTVSQGCGKTVQDCNKDPNWMN